MHRIQMLVFNADKWRAAGGDQPDGNKQFWEKAEIMHTYPDYDSQELLACVQWPDGTLSNGHIVSMMREVPNGDGQENDPGADRLRPEHGGTSL